MKINREGYGIIRAAVIVELLIAVAVFFWLPLWAALIVTLLLAGELMFLLYFFREPSRRLLTDHGIIYAPADGKIVVVEPVEEKEYLNGQKMIQISVFMSVTNVHVNWYPVGGRVEYFKYHPGRFMVAWHPKSSELNERTTTVVDTPGGKVLFRQIAGFVARRIVSYSQAGQTVSQNSKCGFIKFGSRVDVLVPSDSEILVKMDDRVIGSQTPIARFR